jgi:hypothetical protein
MENSKNLSLLFSSLITFLISYLVFAWQEPTLPPPQGNIPAPLNVSLQAQAKEGALILGNNSSVTTGLIVRYGNVGIGTTTPAYKLDIVGDINLTPTSFLRIGGNSGQPGQVLTRTSTGLTWAYVSTSTTTPPAGVRYVFVTGGAAPRGDMQSPLGGVSIYAADNFCKYVADTYGTDLIKGKFWVAALSSSGVTLSDGTSIPGSNFTRGCSEGVTYYYPDGTPVGLTSCPQSIFELVSVITKTESGGSFAVVIGGLEVLNLLKAVMAGQQISIY